MDNINTTLKQVKKRNGNIVPFDPAKIAHALKKAFEATGEGSPEIAEKLCEQIVKRAEEKFKQKIPTVEQVQDLVEELLIEQYHGQTAKSYIIYRQKRQELRETKSALGIEDDMKLSFEALKILRQCSLLKTGSDGSIETPKEMFQRVAKALAQAERKYHASPNKAEQEFAELLTNLDVIPSVSILMNSGTETPQLSDSFVLPVEDDIASLFDTLKQASLLHKSQQRGFGLGFSFSPIRSKGSKVGQSESASGPVAFLRLYDRALRQVNPHGTNLAFLNVQHPDILSFINAKESYDLRSFGISVLLTKQFMKAVEEDKEYPLINPNTKQVVTKLRARSVLDMLATMAWRIGDPAAVFMDNLNKPPTNPFDGEMIEATTPTGEHPLLPYEGCFTAGINISNHVSSGNINWGKLKNSVHRTVHLLDNAIDTCRFALPKMKSAIERTRRIGVGIIGWADALIKLEIAYNTPEATKLAEKLMKFVSSEAKEASMALAKTRGTFADYQNSANAKKNEKVRNASRTTISASGITSIIAGCSQGIEPYYAISYIKRSPTAEVFELVPLFEKVARKEGFYSTELMKKIALAGSLKGIKEIPEKWRKTFVTVHDCSTGDHLAMQVAFQRHTDNGVSKTINLPATATIHEVEEVYQKAHKLGCKSIHVYREGSSDHQLINSRSNVKKKKKVKIEV